jgi:hypothetical protein
MSDLKERFDRAFGGPEHKGLAGRFAVVVDGVLPEGVMEEPAAQQKYDADSNVTCIGTYDREKAVRIIGKLDTQGQEAQMLEWN